MCHHHAPRDLEALRERIEAAEAEADELDIEAAEPEADDRLKPIQPSD